MRDRIIGRKAREFSECESRSNKTTKMNKIIEEGWPPWSQPIRFLTLVVVVPVPRLHRLEESIPDLLQSFQIRALGT